MFEGLLSSRPREIRRLAGFPLFGPPLGPLEPVMFLKFKTIKGTSKGPPVKQQKHTNTKGTMTTRTKKTTNENQGNNKQHNTNQNQQRQTPTM